MVSSFLTLDDKGGGSEMAKIRLTLLKDSPKNIQLAVKFQPKVIESFSMSMPGKGPYLCVE